MGSRFAVRGGYATEIDKLSITGGWRELRLQNLHNRRHANEMFVYQACGEVELPAESQKLYWENASGGQIDLDAVALRSDPEWDAGERKIITKGHPRMFEVEEPTDGHYLILQADAFSEASAGIVIPDIEPSGAPIAEPGGRQNLLTMRAEDVPDWKDWSGAEVNIFPRWGWHNTISSLQRFDPEGRTLHFETAHDIRPGNRYYLTGVRAALTEVGEWHLDDGTGTLRYVARAGSGPPSDAVAAGLTIAIRITGSHIHLRDLVISDTDYSPEGAKSGGDGAIEMSGATDCVLSGCRFDHVNGWGIRLLQRSTRNLIERCTMHDLGQGGIELSGNDYTQPTENRVVANDIADCGRIYAHVAVVYCTASSRNWIAHNRIHRMPRYAISCKSGKGNAAHQNIIEYNDLRDLNLETSDTGGIEIYGSDYAITGNVIRYNQIFNSVGLKMDHKGDFVIPVYAWGIYLDDWCSGVTIHGNIIVGNVVGGVNMHGGRNNLVENNVLDNGSHRQLSLAPIFSQADSRTLKDNVIRRNVVAYSERTAALVWCRPHRWYPEILRKCDENVFWFLGDRMDRKADEIDITPLGCLARWRDAGFDRSSVCEDPLFVDPSGEDYSLQEGSPAFGMGFQRIPVERIGPEGYDPQAAVAAPGAEA